MPIDANLPTLVFDLDGTLVDSAPDLIDALNVVLERDGIAPLPEPEARDLVGAGGRVLIRRGMAAVGRDVSDARLEEMFAAFIAYYEGHISRRSRWFPGVEATLDGLAADGYRLAILTNKYERLARRLIGDLDGTARFAAIVGQDTFPVAKPNGAVLRLTVEKAGGDPARAIMVGDTATDVATARDIGLPVVAVDFGYAQGPAAELAADRLIGDFSALPAAVAALSRDFFAAPAA